MTIEAGIARTKNDVSVVIKNISTFSLSVLMYWAIIYGLMYRQSAGGLFGTNLLAFETLKAGGTYVNFIFQALFYGRAATFLSGTVTDRCAFHAYLLVSPRRPVFLSH